MDTIGPWITICLAAFMLVEIIDWVNTRWGVSKSLTSPQLQAASSMIKSLRDEAHSQLMKAAHFRMGLLELSITYCKYLILVRENMNKPYLDEHTKGYYLGQEEVTQQFIKHINNLLDHERNSTTITRRDDGNTDSTDADRSQPDKTSKEELHPNRD